MDQSIINFKVYEDSVEYVGMAQATLPDLTALTQSISGAGIAGNVEAVILGHFDAMTLGLNFRTVTAATPLTCAWHSRTRMSSQARLSCAL